MFKEMEGDTDDVVDWVATAAGVSGLTETFFRGGNTVSVAEVDGVAAAT